jgi:hypothetical protein
MENILIAAMSFEIGSVWVELSSNEKYRYDFKKIIQLAR